MVTPKADNSELWFLCFANHGDIHLHKVSRQYLEQFLINRVDTNILQKSLFSKGINSKSRLTRVMVLVFCTLFHVALHLFKFHQNICNGFQLTERPQVHSRNGYFQYLLCSKNRKSKSRSTRDMIFVFCALCHDALHL